MDRQAILTSVKARPEVSTLIIGGGINGIGTFRDLALNGIDVLLIDQGDFCSGASAASSHMAHGGLRYLENGEFRLVREAVLERNRLLQNAPHLVKPLPTTIPIFSRFSGLLNAPLKFLGWLDKPGQRGSLVIRIGLIIYEAFAGKKRFLPRHRFINKEKSIERWPHLHPGLLKSATYYDGAIVNPERLALELILDAEQENPRAHALNYASLVGVRNESVVWRDETSGQLYECKPKMVINATGPWIDEVNRLLGFSTHHIGGTKGSHLVLDNPLLRHEIGEHEFFFENDDGRIVLIFPLFNRVLVGTSDLVFDSPEDARCTEVEVDYFLRMIKRIFPGIRVGKDQIVFRYSGVRPLAFDAQKSPGQVTRDHQIQVLDSILTGLPFPIFSLVGGKWTTYRAFSEQMTDKALHQLGILRKKSTRDLPIGGARGLPHQNKELTQYIDSLSAETGLTHEHIQVLFDRYGCRCGEIAEYIILGDDQPITVPFNGTRPTYPNYSHREVAYLSQNEKVVHLDDLILRRTMLAMLGQVTRVLIDEIAGIAGTALDWDLDRKKYESERMTSILADRHGVRV